MAAEGASEAEEEMVAVRAVAGRVEAAMGEAERVHDLVYESQGVSTEGNVIV